MNWVFFFFPPFCSFLLSLPVHTIIRYQECFTDAPGTWEKRKIFSRENTPGSSCTRSIWALRAARCSNTRSISRFCTADTAILAVFLLNTAVLEGVLGFDTLDTRSA